LIVDGVTGTVRRVRATRSLLLVGIAAAFVSGAAVIEAYAFRDRHRTQGQEVTREGVGNLRLGMTYRDLRAAGLVGRLVEGCPVDGVKSASLRAPLLGFAQFNAETPKRLTNVVVSRGATAHGVGRGDRLRSIRRAFSAVRVIRDFEDEFKLTLARIPPRAGGPLEFVLDVRSGRVRQIGVPSTPFCE